MAKNKTNSGNFFEDFYPGKILNHATPRTITEGDISLYTALYGSRFALQSSKAYATGLGYPNHPVDDFLLFHIVFGKTVSDISLNAIANLGYAEGRFLAPVYCGESLHSTSEVIGVKENSSGKTGVVYVRTKGWKSDGTLALEYVRWVMVRKRDQNTKAPPTLVPELSSVVAPETLGGNIPPLNRSGFDAALSGSPDLFEAYDVGEKIDHVDGITVEEAEHQIATRMFQNTAKVHFNQFSESKGRFGRRLIYGGHVISLARTLSFNGLANAYSILALNGGQHVSPLFAGDTVFAWSQVLDKADIENRADIGALRLKLVATKDRPCHDFPCKNEDNKPLEGVLLELDYWAAILKE